MVFRNAFLLAAGLAALPLAFHSDPADGGPVGLATAFGQQMGNDPWNYPRATRGFWANYQAVKKSQDGVAGGAGGGGSGAEVLYYYSSSTAIANQQIINQDLGDNTTGVIDTQTNQVSDGNQ
ncbi:MAG: hypothetical protein AB1918_08650, partial [Pseudomonadota bacterium]